VILLLGGIALPWGAVLINHQKLRHRFWESLVALAGPVATIIFVVACAQFAQAPVSYELKESLAFLTYLCAGVAILNLLPVPPLDGYGIWEPWLPIALKQKLAPLNRFGFWIIFAVLWFVPYASDILWGSAAAIAMLLGVNPDLIQQGSNTFHRSAQPLGLGLIVIAIIANQIKGKAKPVS
jgi:Zn-dependent protease